MAKTIVDSQPSTTVDVYERMALTGAALRAQRQTVADELFGNRIGGAVNRPDYVREYLGRIERSIHASERYTTAHIEAGALLERAAAHLSMWESAMTDDNAALAAIARADLQSDIVHLAARMPSSVAGDKAASGAMRELKAVARNVARTPLTYRPASVNDMVAAVTAIQAERDRKANERAQKELAITATVAADATSVEASK